MGGGALQGAAGEPGARPSSRILPAAHGAYRDAGAELPLEGRADTGLTIILFENFTDFRQIFTDGRDFPEERAPTWFGYSLGRWDGDTFVVNTLGFNDKAWLDDGGHPRSEEMKVTERFRRKDVGHLEIEFTFDDPKAYTRPWSATVPFELIPDSEIIENICENEQDIKHIFFDQKNAK